MPFFNIALCQPSPTARLSPLPQWQGSLPLSGGFPPPCLQLQRRLVFSDTSQSELTSTQFPQLCPSFLKSAKGRPTPPDPQAENKASAVTHPHPTSAPVRRVSAAVAPLTCLPSAAVLAWPPTSLGATVLFSFLILQSRSEPPASSSCMSQVDHAFLFPPHLSIPPHLPGPSVPEALTLTTL